MADGTQRGTVAVVIPYHRATLEAGERLAMSRCRDVLGGHPRFLAVPERLDTSALRSIDPDIQETRFGDEFFASARGYNLLCRTPEFYGRFRAFEFILIYQLDAFVFDDQLAAWCREPWDYIGAPWPRFEHSSTSKKWYLRLPVWRLVLGRTGQGGFSLRRVAPMEAACRRLAWFVRRTEAYPEDVFWSSALRHIAGLRLADFETSLRFSFDGSPDLCYRLSGGRLPFGCHGWNVQPEFWQDKIPGFPPELRMGPQ